MLRYNRCYTLSVPKNECCPFRCGNGGTRLPLVSTVLHGTPGVLYHCLLFDREANEQQTM